MKIAVCIKQVPRLDDVRFNRANRIVREGVALVINPLDLEALGHALELRAHGDEVIALTMGPPSARDALEEAVRRGADRAIHLSDKRFAGADTLATARALARALQREAPDLVLFGRMAIDGATSQVGPQVAELMAIPQVTHVTALTVSDGKVTAERETERGSETWAVPVPAAISVERGPAPPEPELDRPVVVEDLTAEELGGTPRDYGTRGSPTFVKEVTARGARRAGERLTDCAEAARRVEGLISDAGAGAGPPSPASRPAAPAALWVVVERDGSSVHPTTLEALACARTVAAELEADVVAVVCCSDPPDDGRELIARGADRVLLIRDPTLAEYTTAGYTAALCSAVDEHQPVGVICSWSTQGRDFAPRVAARLETGITGDFDRLEVRRARDDRLELYWVKPAWAGTVEAPIKSHRAPAMGTLRPGVFKPLPARPDRDVRIEEFRPEIAEATDLVRKSRVETGEGELIENAPVVLCAGARLSDGEFRKARELARALDAPLAAPEESVEAGRVAPQAEISVLRRTISPAVFIALGCDATVNIVPARGSARVVTVHPDPGAPAHSHADLSVVADVAEFVDAMHRALDAQPGAALAAR